MQFSQIGIIAACSHTKSRPVHQRLRARALKAGTTECRAKEWIERISNGSGGLPAFNLYSGVYWAGVANLSRKASPHDSEAPLWILSAGYGLIHRDAAIVPYTATFRPKDEDSVVPESGAAQARLWWEKLGDWAGPQPGAPRNLPALATAHPGTLWIVVAGAHYLHAIAHQLEVVHQQDGGAGRFVLVSPGASGRSVASAIGVALLRADARWESLLGRGKVSIGVKIATHLVERAKGNVKAIPRARKSIERETEKLECPRPLQRTPQTNDDVRRYLKKALKKQPDLSFSRALRTFRDSGLACEYRRFRRLYEEAKEMHAKAQ